MSGPGRSPSRGVRRLVAVAVLVLVALLLPVGSASAHATLLRSDPTDGEVLAKAPTTATFVFNEPVSSIPHGVRLFDAAGKEVRSTASTRDARLVVDLPALARGTYVVAWRVVSADGHPIAGSLTFSVGAPSATPVRAEPLAEPPRIVGVLLAVAQAATYLGIFGACGLALFVVLVLPRTADLDDVRARASSVARPFAVLALAASVLLPPVSLLNQRAEGLGTLGDGSFWPDVLRSPETLASFLAAFGTATAVFLAGARPRGRAAVLLAAVVALGSLSLVGHTRSVTPTWLMVAADLSHVSAGTIWFGGLVGLVLALRLLGDSPRTAAVVVGRFSDLAASLLVLVAVTGTLMGQRILGSWAALLHSDFGHALLVKVGVVAVVALIAAWNRWRLVPSVLREESARARAGARTLRRSVQVESALLVGVLAITGLLVDRSPVPTQAVTSSAATTYVGTASDVRVLAEVRPARVGRNVVVLRLQAPDGSALRPVELPTVSANDGDLALGERATIRRSGGYAVALVLPRAGTWKLNVSVRLSEFENPVVTVRVPVASDS